MKKIISMLLLVAMVIAMCFIVVGCNADKDKSASNANGKQEYTFKLGINTNEDSVRGAMAIAFKESVETASAGRIIVDLYYGESLGNEPEQVEAVKLGAQDFTIAGATLFGAMDPAFNAMSLPFKVESFEDAHKQLDGAIGDAWKNKAEGFGYKILGYGDLGFSQITNSKHPINSLDDMKGLNIRTPNDPLLTRTIQSLGASATTMAFSELYMALSQGVVDGQFNPVDAIVQNKFIEVQDYLAYININYITILLLTSTQLYDSLSEEDQNIIAVAAMKAQEVGRAYAVEAENQYMSQIEESLEITRPNIAEFRESVQPVYDEFSKSIDSEFAKLFE